MCAALWLVKSQFNIVLGLLKPLGGLKLKELREELHTRRTYDTDKPKKKLQEQLSEVLKGAQRVPTLLLQNPQQALSISTCKIIQC